MQRPNGLTSNAHWNLRAGIVSVFLVHGVRKFMSLQGFADLLPISYEQVVLVAFAQVTGGMLIILGGFRNDRWSDNSTNKAVA